ncbi:MAG: hypothetical protein AB1730_05495 [Myxococcota bacterium]
MSTLALLLSALHAVALAATDGGVSCVEVEQRLQAAQRALATCTDTTRSLSTARDRCEAALDDATDKAATSANRLEACVQEKEQQCQEAAALAASLLQGSARGVGACVPAATLAQLQQLVDGWFALSKALAQLDEYATGSSDVLPRGPGVTDAERHLGRVLGARSGVPLWNRRLLVEAFRLTAPEAWRRLKGQGATAVETFFESRGPLPETFIGEAKGEHEGAGGSAGPPLTAALRLTQAYLQLARCDDRPDSRECGRARQLVDLLDATGPLLVRRRVEELYATPCDAIRPDMLRGWLQDLPVSRREERQATLAELSQAARAKLFLCYLGDVEGDASYRAWVAPRLPPPASLDARTLPLVDAFSKFVADGDPVDRCGRAVRALERLPSPKMCAAEGAETLAALSGWARAPAPAAPSPEWQLCQRVARLLWSGAAVSLPESPAEPVHVDDEATATTVAQLREACDARLGVGGRFEEGLGALAAIGAALGETPTSSPWRLDGTGGRPQEKARLANALEVTAWVQHVVAQESVCDALGLSPARCDACREAAPGTHYDCDAERELKEAWARYRRLTRAGAAGLIALVLFLSWALRQWRARRTVAGLVGLARESLEGLGLDAARDAWRLVFPSRHDTLRLTLPRTPAWERWGHEACAVFAPGAPALHEADVNHAAAVAQRHDVKVVFLLHPDTASPDLGAVRAILDWAARGGTRAVQVLPLALSRLAWATRDEDLLDLVEATSLRGNPFEVRGPVRSSSQFWNRERLVAGLLTESRSGNWTIVTGLRRFGKSSLALEVARRLTGPSAYVDLAGFHHEVMHGETPAVAVEAVLRTLVARLMDSAAARYPAAVVPPAPTGSLDAPTLAAWLKGLGVACGTSAGTAPPTMLLVLDEVEQLLSSPPEKLGRALDVLATLVGRLRSAVADPSAPHAGSTVGVTFCAAMHPLLWAPLATLGGQSLMGAFPSICVPALDDEAARSMMRGLGAQQGIRFDDDALAAMVRASQGVPLLLRRLGTSVLELYDADRARQGALGATRIGVEGAAEAIRRETRGGSPLRVWVESEIAPVDGPAGVMLRALAQADEPVPVTKLQRLVETQVMDRFATTGLDAHLPPSELKRRAQEAASVMVRLLADSRLLEEHGDLTAPESYSLPDGVLRTILSEGAKA